MKETGEENTYTQKEDELHDAAAEDDINKEDTTRKIYLPRWAAPVGGDVAGAHDIGDIVDHGNVVGMSAFVPPMGAGHDRPHGAVHDHRRRLHGGIRDGPEHKDTRKLK